MARARPPVEDRHQLEKQLPATSSSSASPWGYGTLAHGRKCLLGYPPGLLYLDHHIGAYIDRHRGVLLADGKDLGTFFVRTVKQTSIDAAYDQATFYDAWRLTIFGQLPSLTGRYGLKGLLPHGPHNVRDVLATHILNQTGSYEQASYAIQDTPEMIQEHYRGSCRRTREP